MTIEYKRIQLLTRLTTEWIDDDPVLLEGEAGIADVGSSLPTVKIGDGVRAWSGLPPLMSEAPTYIAGIVTTLPPGTDATVTIDNTTTPPSMSFGIPRGATGPTGPAPILNIGATTTLPAGSPAAVEITAGTPPTYTLRFSIPRGNDGLQGPAGVAGASGAAGPAGPSPSLSISSTTTLPAGSSATVSMSGTSPTYAFAFGIPKGDTGASGPAGAPGVQGPPGSIDGATQSLITSNDETATLPNSRRLVAGSSIAFDTTSAGQLVISSSASSAVGADPSASVGLAAINGVAATFMRSDAAPALSQAIVPTWSGVHTFNAQLRIASGSAAAPGIAFAAATDTGLEYDATVPGVWFVRAGARAFGYGPNSVLFLKPCFQSDGTAIAPSYTFLNSQQAGLFLPVPGVLGIATAGTERLRIGPDGQFGFAGANYGSIGQVLTSGGAAASPSWQTPSGGGGTPGGATTNVQYNDGGAFGGDSKFTWDKTNFVLTLSAFPDVATITTGIGTTVATSAPLSIRTGTPTATAIAAGGITIQPGAPIGGNAAGASTFVRGGNASGNGVPGQCAFLGGNAGTQQNGAPVRMVGGTGGSVSGAGGTASVEGGNANVSTGNGGPAQLKGGLPGASGVAGAAEIYTNDVLRLRVDALGTWLLGAALAAGTAGQVLASNGAGAAPTWQTASGGGGTPGGSTTQVQFNNSGAFSGDADFTWDATNNTLTVGSVTTFGLITSGGGLQVRGSSATGGVGGNVTVSSGAGQANTAGGQTNINTGNGNGTGAGGALTVKSGNGGTTSGAGGPLNLQTGNGGSTNGAGGDITITPGNGVNGGNGGAVIVNTGPAGSGAAGGAFTLVTANGGSGGTNGGDISLTSGNGVATNQNAGTVTLATGTRNGTGTANLTFKTNGATRLTIDAAGAWNMAGTTPGTAGQILTSNGAAAPTWQAAPSDARMKDAIERIERGLAIINALTPVSFRWKPDTGRDDDQRHLGLIAQEVLPLIPSAVSECFIAQGGEAVKRYDLHFAEITPLLIRAVQELSARVLQLELAQRNHDGN